MIFDAFRAAARGHLVGAGVNVASASVRSAFEAVMFDADEMRRAAYDSGVDDGRDEVAEDHDHDVLISAVSEEGLRELVVAIEAGDRMAARMALEVMLRDVPSLLAVAHLTLASRACREAGYPA